MKLDRNVNGDGEGKYALILKRNLSALSDGVRPQAEESLRFLKSIGVLDDSRVGDDGEFFVIRLRDKYAGDALASYSMAAMHDDVEYASEIGDMSARAGMNHPACKAPD